MNNILYNSVILNTSLLLTSSEMGGGKKSSTIGFTIRPNIYRYTNSLVNTKLFCRLLMEVTS